MVKVDKRISIYLDLDGPVLDVSERYYRVHCEILKKLGLKNSLSKEQYWRLKRRKAELSELNSGLSGKTAFEYRDKWLRYIELRGFIIYDRLWPYARESLKALEKHARLILVTARFRKRNLYWMLREKDLLKYFDNIYTVRSSDGPYAKTNSIANDKHFDPVNSIVIGDTELDVGAGKKCKAYSVALLSGIRSRQYLSGLKPDMICADLQSFLKRAKGRLF